MAKNGTTLRRRVKILLERKDYGGVLELMTEGWEDSFFYDSLTIEQQEYAEDFINMTFDYGYRYIGVPPDKWDLADWEEMLLGIFPKKFSAERAVFEEIAPVMSQFVLFHGTTGYFTHARSKADYINSLSEEIVMESEDESNWGPAKRMLMNGQIGSNVATIRKGCFGTLILALVLIVQLVLGIILIPFRFVWRLLKKIF